jgi:hypothetical protein
VPTGMIGRGRVHAWATVSLFGHAPEKQVSRWGLPLVTHLFLNDPDNQESKETFNTCSPSEDIVNFSKRIGDFAAKMSEYAGSVVNPAEYGEQVAQRLCPATRYRKSGGRSPGPSAAPPCSVASACGYNAGVQCCRSKRALSRVRIGSSQKA